MPIYPPRNEPVKKREEPSKHLQGLQHALKNDFSEEKLNKAVEKFRTSQLSLLKAQVHVIKEKQFQNKPVNIKIEKIENEIIKWTSVSIDEIINTVKKNYKY